MPKNHDEAAKSLAQIRTVLADWLEGSKESGEPVAKILRLLEPIDSLIHDGQRGPLPFDGFVYGTKHVIEVRGHEEMLVEKRRSGSAPYRVSKGLYIVVIKALAGSEKGPTVTFAKIMKAVGKEISNVPDWHVRVVLRFLLKSSRPHLLRRTCSEYRAISHRGVEYETEAMAAWSRLAESS